MVIKGIGHTAYFVRDMERSLSFYCDVLGLEKAFELHNEQDEPWIVYLKISERQFIELFYHGKDGTLQPENAAGYHHLCLEVEDIHQIADHLNKKGWPLDVEPTKGVDHNYQCWATDPDGNRIEFMQLMPDSPHLKGK